MYVLQIFSFLKYMHDSIIFVLNYLDMYHLEYMFFPLNLTRSGAALFNFNLINVSLKQIHCVFLRFKKSHRLAMLHSVALIFSMFLWYNSLFTYE